MKNMKLIIGIVSIVLSLVVFFQSFFATVGDAMVNKGGTSGGIGVFVGILMLIAGIIAIAARSSKGGGIVCLIFYALAGILGVASNGIYKDLIIWGVLCLIFAVLFLLSLFTKKQTVSSVGEQSN